ncbi:MAG: hypothetical protein HY984_02395 [Candidatus Magasanikbacteria bacterium]|nr:hypothetical protein [Candidatus Magasanikbacteria bacterium]
MLAIREFFVEGKHPEKSHVLLHVTEPSTKEELAKGYFFAISEIDNGTTEQIEHLQKLIDDFESGYYETDEEAGRDAFEVNVEFINRRGHHILQNQHARVHCVLGVIRGQAVSLTYHGEPVATLLYQDKTGPHQLPIIEPNSDDVKPGQLFSALLQGSLNPGDHLYVSTPNVTEFIPLDRIEKLVFSRPTEQTVEHVEKVLRGARTAHSYGGLLAHFLTKEEIPKTGRQPKFLLDDSAKSMERLATREQSTEQLLSPKLIRETKQKMKDYVAARNEEPPEQVIPKEGKATETNYRPRRPKRPSPVGALLTSFARAMVLGGRGLVRVVGKGLRTMGKLFIAIILLITNKGGQRQTVLHAWQEWLAVKKQAVRDLSLVSKILFGVAVAATITFFVGVSYLRWQTARTAMEQARRAEIQELQTKSDDAEARLRYGDEAAAASLVADAKRRLELLIKERPQEMNKLASLQTNLKRLDDKLQKRELIAPTLIAEIKAADQARLEKLVMIDGNLIAYGPEETHFYHLDSTTKKLTSQEYSPLFHLRSGSTPKENDVTVFAIGDQGIAAYDKKTGVLSTKDIQFPLSNTRLRDIFVYNQRLYTLDVGNGRIYKHNRTQTGYDRGQNWLKDNGVKLDDAVSFAIDGDVYVLNARGEILHFSGGNQVPLATTGLLTPLAEPKIIWTYNGVDDLYVLEAKEKRVIVMGKSGQVKKQYTAKEWQSPTGMAIDTNRHRIFILDNNKIYEFPI